MGVYAFLTTCFGAAFGPSRRFAFPFQSRLKPDMLQYSVDGPLFVVVNVDCPGKLGPGLLTSVDDWLGKALWVKC
jgi:hypothetical protein